MRKKIFVFLVLFLTLPLFSGWAKNDYIYRQRVNWVKVDKADPKEIPLSDLRHPYTAISSNQMEAMLLSIKISKKHLLKKEVNSVDVFNTFEARKYSSYLVDALSRVGPEQVVNFSIVHKRPLFILRNDRLTMGNLFVAGDGVHFQFTKLFAKLSGDYEASANMDKMVRKAKTSRVSLEASEGQVLSYTNPTEIILQTGFDFIPLARQNEEEKKKEEEEAMKAKMTKKGAASSKKNEGDDLSRGEPEKTTKEESSSDEDMMTARSYKTGVVESEDNQKSASQKLKEIEDLKKEKLISEKEYQELRKKILSEL